MQYLFLSETKILQSYSFYDILSTCLFGKNNSPVESFESSGVEILVRLKRRKPDLNNGLLLLFSLLNTLVGMLDTGELFWPFF